MNEVQKRQWARSNYMIGESIPENWDDIIIEECSKMNEEAEESRKQQEEADRAAIKETLSSISELEEEFRGNVIMKFHWRGSLQEGRKADNTEREALLVGLSDERRKSIKEDTIQGKRLFAKTGFREWEDLKSMREKWRKQIKGLGIPFLGQGGTVMKVTLVPRAIKLAKEIKDKQAELVKKLIAAYPTAISSEVVKSAIYDAADYRPVESLTKLFDVIWWFERFGDLGDLKDIEESVILEELQRTQEMWGSVKNDGVLMLRKLFTDLTNTLVEAVKPDGDGNKKRFYASSVTNILEAIDALSYRNIAGDTEIEQQAQKLKSLLTGKDLKDFKEDDTFRKSIEEKGTEISKELQGLVVSAANRIITFE